MPGQDERIPLPRPDGAIIQDLQKDRKKQEERLRELETRIAELEEKEKYWKIARQMYPGKSDKEIEADIRARLSEILEVDDGK